MILKFITVLASMLPMAAMAENIAVEKMNYSVGAWSTKADYSDHDSMSNMIYGSLVLPVSSHVGARFSLTLDERKPTDGYLDSQQAGFASTVFARDHNLGSAGLYYKKSIKEVDSNVQDYEVKTDTYKAWLAYYLNDFTLGLTTRFYETETTRLNDSIDDYESTDLTAVWYVNDEWSSNVAIGQSDSRDVYRFTASYQPEFFSRKTRFILAYDDYQEYEVISLGINYSFNVSASLKDRARRY